MKFSIVTPAQNVAAWLPFTIESVLSQKGDFDIEYIIVIDPSTDHTNTIAHEYSRRLQEGTLPVHCRSISMRVIELSGSGSMYNALTAGFSKCSGDIFSWINADDIYEPKALETIERAFLTFPNIDWVKGVTATIEADGHRSREGQCRIYHQEWLKNGLYGREAYFVEQDSVFWRSSLWRELNGFPTSYTHAGDYWLWMQYAQHAPLWSLNAKISCFRKRSGQLSKASVKYRAEQIAIRPQKSLVSFLVRLFFSLRAHMSPYGELFFLTLYPVIFRQSREYLECTPEGITKKTMQTFRLPGVQ